MNNRQSPSDHDLIQQYLEGNTSVLPVLVARYHKVFCEQAYWVTKDKEAAKDIAQECWITIIDKLHSLERLDSFKSWASRIVYTKAIDSLKHKKKEVERLGYIVIRETDTSTSEDDSQQMHKAVLRAIQQLPKEKQDIIRLFYAEEYSIVEISDFLNIPIGTVKSRLFKAREKLKSIIQNNNYEK